jgi:hypothetical protein
VIECLDGVTECGSRGWGGAAVGGRGDVGGQMCCCGGERQQLLGQRGMGEHGRSGTGQTAPAAAEEGKQDQCSTSTSTVRKALGLVLGPVQQFQIFN